MNATTVTAEKWIADFKRKHKACKGKHRGEVEVTPEIAAMLLTLNACNFRKLNRDTAKQYARMMRDGKWTWNSQPIWIDDNLNLGDGQHRLQAVIDAEVSIDFEMTIGGNPESTVNVDSGRKRQMEQKIEHKYKIKKNKKRITTGAYLVLKHYNNDRHDDKQWFHHPDALDFIGRNKEKLEDAAAMYTTAEFGWYINPAHFTALAFIISGNRLASECSDLVKFSDKFLIGEDLKREFVAYRMRKKSETIYWKLKGGHAVKGSEEIVAGSAYGDPKQRSYLFANVWNKLGLKFLTRKNFPPKAEFECPHLLRLAEGCLPFDDELLWKSPGRSKYNDAVKHAVGKKGSEVWA